MDAEDRGRALVMRLVSGSFEEIAGDFDATMAAALPAPKLAEAWASVAPALGGFGAIEKVEVKPAGPVTAVVVTCAFERRKMAIRTAFSAESGQIAGLFFEMISPAPDPNLPSYADLSVFSEAEVRVGEGSDGLDGTLSVPNGDGPFPAVVLVHGSGPHDRDETVGANRPFRDLALGLASKGIAVLRYVKRTKGNPASLAKVGVNLTVKEETIDDAVLAVELLRKTPRIDPGRVFVVGHSLGAFVAPRIAEAAPEVKGLVLLAGNVRPLEDLVLDQFEYLLPMQAPPDVVKTMLDALRVKVAKVKSSTLTPDTPVSELPLPVPAPYWIDLKAYSPTETALRVGKPMLILQGGRDYQVTTEDFELWKAALGELPFASFELFPDLSHLLMKGEGKSRPEEYEVAGHVAAEVIESIARFILG